MEDIWRLTRVQHKRIVLRCRNVPLLPCYTTRRNTTKETLLWHCFIHLLIILHAPLTSDVDHKKSYQGKAEKVNLISKTRRIKKSPSLHCDVTNLEVDWMKVDGNILRNTNYTTKSPLNMSQIWTIVFGKRWRRGKVCDTK